MLVSPIGYFLLQGKISNKAVSAAYSVCLCMVIVGAMVCSAFSQSVVVSMDETMDNSIVLGIRDYFDDHGNIPDWLHQLQTHQKCCGFSGPEDWRKLIYPHDKPAIEDVPESCCVTQLVDCNLVLDSFHNKSDLSHWIFTDGCRKFIERRLGSLLDCVAYASVVLLMTGAVLVTIYWIQLTTVLKQPDPSTSVPPEPLQSDDLPMNENEMECSESVTPAIPGSDMNSRIGSLTAIRTVQFEKSPGRPVLKKTKSATNTGGQINNNNNNSVKQSPPPLMTMSDDLDEDDPGDRLNVKQIKSTSNSGVASRRNSVGKVGNKRSKGLIRQNSKIRQ